MLRSSENHFVLREMNNMFKVLSPKLFGKKYEKAIKSIIASIIIFFGMREIDYSITMSQKVLLFTNLFFSGTIMLQFFGSEDNARYLKGFFAMPFSDKRTFVLEYASAAGLYTLLTKSIFIFSLIFAFVEFSVCKAVLLASHFIFVCLGSMAVYACLRDKKILSLLLIAVGTAMCFVLPEGYTAAAVFAAADIILAAVLCMTDPYRFMKYRSKNAGKKSSVHSNRFLVTKYILRYILSNKSYMISTLIIIAFISYLAKTMGDMNFKNSSILGMALMSVNTPLAIIVSSSRTLKKKLCSMPDKFRNFYLPYASVLFVFYIISYAILLGVLAVLGTKVTLLSIIAAVLFAVQASAVIIFLEDRYTLQKWSTESDLWHNPRKYVTPLLLVAETFVLQLF